MKRGDTIRVIDTNNPIWREGQIATLVTPDADGWMAEFTVGGYTGRWWIASAHIEKVDVTGGKNAP